jgi:hypothetical protein
MWDARLREVYLWEPASLAIFPRGNYFRDIAGHAGCHKER